MLLENNHDADEILREPEESFYEEELKSESDDESLELEFEGKRKYDFPPIGEEDTSFE